MGGVSDMIIQCGGVKVGKGEEGVESVKEKCGESIRCGDGKSEVELGEVNVSRELEGRDSCIGQESCVVAVYMEDSCQRQIKTSLHFFEVCVAVNVAQVLEKVR